MKILLVDDAVFIRMSLKKLLEESSYQFEFLEACNGLEAVSMYEQKKPDLVIMDITMPGMDGITAVGKIREIHREAKIIMCSSMGQQNKVVEAIAAGAQDFVVKPYTDKKILDSIKKVMHL